jgi:hypothetical protein
MEDKPVVVLLRYPAYVTTFDEAAEQRRPKVPVFGNEIPGLIDKTRGDE